MDIRRYLCLLVTFVIPIVATAQIPKVSAGSIRQFANFPSRFVPARNVDVWLPSDFDQKKKYAVLYMHDGRALFDSTIMWNGQEWRADETMNSLLQKKKIRNCIVVGISNGEARRHSEYFPQKPFESLGKATRDSIYKSTRNGNQPLFTDEIQSDNYLRFLVQELKPFIDKSFPTLPDRSNTFVAGSSMGGLISLYAICEYPDIFGGAACISTHWVGTFSVENNPIPATFLRYMKKHLPNPRNHKIYFDYGSLTLDALYKPFQLQADEIMRSKGYKSNNWITREFPGADHSERSWSKRFDIPLIFLLGSPK